jgi:hypothetical protein
MASARAGQATGAGGKGKVEEGNMATKRSRRSVLRNAVGAGPEPPANPLCHDPGELAWQALSHRYHELQLEFERLPDPPLANECRAAVSVIHRVLRCQESGAQALGAVRAVFTKISTVLRYTEKLEPFQERLLLLQAGLEDVCRLAPCQGCHKPAGECSCGGSAMECGCSEAMDTGFTNYGQWLEVERSGALLEEAMVRFDDVLVEVGPHLPYGAKMEERHALMREATAEFSGLLRGARAAAASCDPKAVDDVLRALHDRAARVTFAYDRLQCHLGQIDCITPVAFFSMLQAEADAIGLLAATLLRSVHKLSAPCSAIGTQLRKVWLEMRIYEAGPLKHAFSRYEQHQLCPAADCYERATADLRKIIETGLAECQSLSMDAYGCDESAFLRHRHLVDMAVQEIMRLDCKDLEGFERCVWARLGSFTMRLYAILGRSTNLVAEQVRTLADSLLHLKQWFDDMSKEPPTDVVPFLRAGLAIIRSLESRAHGYGVCAQVPTGPCPDYGQMELRIVDDNEQPLSGVKVHITTQSGQKHESIADQNGYIREILPKGPYTISATGGEFPALTMVVQ